MPIYWTIKSIPELANVAPASERRRLWRIAYFETFGHWQTWMAIAAMGVFCLVGNHAGGQWDLPMLGTVIGGAIGSFVFGQVVSQTARPYLRGPSVANRKRPKGLSRRRIRQPPRRNSLDLGA
jgi:hypothetical protein